MPPIRKKLNSFNKKIKIDEFKHSKSPLPDRSFYLRRGKACHICRKKKLKCDGVRPVCGYCQRHDRQCEFDDPETWGKQRQLQFQVEELTAKLEATRRESNILVQVLEEQKALNRNFQALNQLTPIPSNQTALGLTFNHDLHELTRSADIHSNRSHIRQDFAMDFDNPAYQASPTQSPTSSLSSPFESMTCSTLTSPRLEARSTDDLDSPLQIDTPPTFLDLKLTSNSQLTLLGIFMPHTSQFCLDISTTEILSRFEQGGSRALHDSFLHAMFAASCHFATRNIQFNRHQSRFRQGAQFALRPRAVLSRADIFDCIRAAIVLAVYFNMQDYLKEASTYIAIAFGYFLELDQTKDSCRICEIARECTPEERLAFQSAYIVDRLIAAQLQSPVIFPEEMTDVFSMDYISDIMKHEKRRQPSSVTSQAAPSVSPGMNRLPLDQITIMELRVRCSSLMWNVSQSIKLEEDATALLAQAKKLRSALPSIYTKPSSAMESNVDLTILSIHTQVFAALTKLTRRCFPREGSCLEMAGEVVALIHELCDHDFALLDPIIGLCWEWSTEAILGELSSLVGYLGQQSTWSAKIQFTVSAMEKLAAHIPVVSVNIANLALQCHAWNVPLSRKSTYV